MRQIVHSILAILLVTHEAGLHADDLELGQGLANGQHIDLRLDSGADGEVRGDGIGDRGGPVQ